MITLHGFSVKNIIEKPIANNDATAIDVEHLIDLFKLVKNYLVYVLSWLETPQKFNNEDPLIGRVFFRILIELILAASQDIRFVLVQKVTKKVVYVNLSNSRFWQLRDETNVGLLNEGSKGVVVPVVLKEVLDLIDQVLLKRHVIVVLG